jgi:GH35 family endo-1,4-beta-xylanase
MRISVKQEEWGLFDYPGMEDINARIDMARSLFIGALQKLDDPPAAARLADEALALAMIASDEMCSFHAAVFLARRKQQGGFSGRVLGVCLPLGANDPRLIQSAAGSFDFVRVPLTWREIQPKERGVKYDTLDNVIKQARKAGLGVRAGPLLNFGVQFVPDWMYIWENDYEAITDFAREHVRRSVMRYAGKVDAWIVASGLHADSVFAFSFEQIMDLTRTAVAVTKQADPRTQVVLDIVQPWGEYYARNQRTVLPLLYAEMAAQGGVAFDAFGLQLLFGLGAEGYHLRDALQISSLLDRLANLGKPLHITAVSVPSKPTSGGSWRGSWSEQTQADWLAAFIQVALSKPFVESVCLNSLADCVGVGASTGGVVSGDLSPKPAYKRIAAIRSQLGIGRGP